MSSAIMLRNQSIAKRFTEEFMENFRSVGLMSDQKMSEIVSQLRGVTPDVRRQAIHLVDDLLR